MASTDRDMTAEFRERVKAAIEAREALRIVGGGSKDFYGPAPSIHPNS